MNTRRWNPLKVIFALEYLMQGLANPFQGLLYQPFVQFFKASGMEPAATQALFSKAYVAWGFKPVLGFLIDAYGKTKTTLIFLLLIVMVGFALTPASTSGPILFFVLMFTVSIFLAATDVTVDRATVIAGDEESRTTGQSKAKRVGLNQSVCWATIYGTSILAAVIGGYVATHMHVKVLMPILAAIPLIMLVTVLFLPKERTAAIPLKRSVLNFWNGLNTGPILGVMAFYFIFHFQPALGTLWNSYQTDTLQFTPEQIGIADGVGGLGLFLGVLFFVWKGVNWIDTVGLRKIFRIYIFASIILNITSYMLLEPTFGKLAKGIHAVAPFLDENTSRLVYLCTYNFFSAMAAALIRMSTFSLVGAVIPVAAAGSLFAGFMSVANLAYSFSYQTGSWLYDNGIKYSFLNSLQMQIFNIPKMDHLSINMLILIGTAAYLLSFLVVGTLPERRETRQGAESVEHPGPERWRFLKRKTHRAMNISSVVFGAGLCTLGLLKLGWDPIQAVIISFFISTLLRKVSLDALLRRTWRRSQIVE
jgi:hypothetical protein